MYLIIFFLVIILLYGSLTALIKIKKDKIADKEISYKLDFSDIIAKIYISVPFLFLTIMTLYLIIDNVINESIYYLLGLILPILCGFISILPLIVFFQYLKIEYGRIIKFNPLKRRVIIQEKDKTVLIDNSEIKLVEYHNAISDKAPFDFEYIRLTLKDGSQVILTNLLTDINNYECMFKGIKRKRNKERILNIIR